MSVRIFTFAAVVLLNGCAHAEQQAVVTPAETAAAASPAVADGGSAPAASRVDPAAIDTSRDYRIGPEDVLDVLVWKQTELSRTVPVRPDGKISLPLVNDIVAAGLTANELKAQITERLTPYIQAPEVSVIVKEIHSFKVSIQGNVRMPNQYEVRSEATVLDIIARAQGFNEYADKKNIDILRRSGGRETTMKFNYERVKDNKDPNVFVQPGDIIIVN